MDSPRHTLEDLLHGRDLSEAQAADLLRQLTTIDLSPAMGGALLAALRAQGVTSAEVWPELVSLWGGNGGGLGSRGRD